MLRWQVSHQLVLCHTLLFATMQAPVQESSNVPLGSHDPKSSSSDDTFCEMLALMVDGFMMVLDQQVRHMLMSGKYDRVLDIWGYFSLI